MKLQSLLYFALTVILLSSCTKENEEDLTQNCIPAGGVRFSVEVRNILQASCTTCHNQQLALGGIMLHDYDNVRVYVDNGSLLGSIKHQQGFSAMPQGQARLPQCNIDLIEAWINDGALNN